MLDLLLMENWREKISPINIHFQTKAISFIALLSKHQTLVATIKTSTAKSSTWGGG